MEIKSIVCPIDGSDLTDAIMDAAIYMGKISGAKVTLVHIVEKWYKGADVISGSKEWKEIHEKWNKEGWAVLEKRAEQLKAAGVKDINVALREGDAAYEIIATAIEQQANLVIMATHGHSAVGKLFVGSVTDKVTKKAPCPVMWIFKK